MPVYEDLPGWSSDISGVRTYDELPKEARQYIELIEERVRGARGVDIGGAGAPADDIEGMRALLVGGGGREHALAWALRRSGSLGDLLLLPGNPGMSTLGHRIEGSSRLTSGRWPPSPPPRRVDLVVVGPRRRWRPG